MTSGKYQRELNLSSGIRVPSLWTKMEVYTYWRPADIDFKFLTGPKVAV